MRGTKREDQGTGDEVAVFLYHHHGIPDTQGSFSHFATQDGRLTSPLSVPKDPESAAQSFVLLLARVGVLSAQLDSTRTELEREKTERGALEKIVGELKLQLDIARDIKEDERKIWTKDVDVQTVGADGKLEGGRSVRLNHI